MFNFYKLGGVYYETERFKNKNFAWCIDGIFNYREHWFC